MSKPTGIEAAACEIVEDDGVKPGWSDYEPLVLKYSAIIAKHCVSKKEYQEKLDASELEVKRLARIAGFNSPHHVNT